MISKENVLLVMEIDAWHVLIMLIIVQSVLLIELTTHQPVIVNMDGLKSTNNVSNVIPRDVKLVLVILIIVIYVLPIEIIFHPIVHVHMVNTKLKMNTVTHVQLFVEIVTINMSVPNVLVLELLSHLVHALMDILNMEIILVLNVIQNVELVTVIELTVLNVLVIE
jgi:hypothetical protein